MITLNFLYMKKTSKKFWSYGFLLLMGTLLLQACNKDLPEATPIEHPTPSGQSIMEKLNDAEYSILKAAITKASTFNSPTGKLSDLLNDKKKVFTFFAPDNTALANSFVALGLPVNDVTALNYLRNGQLDTIIKYHLIGGQQFTSSTITPAAPSLNLYLQSSFLLQAPSAAVPPGVRMPVFLGKQGPVVFANYMPVTQADIALANGTMHKLGVVALLPPSQVLWQRIATDPDLTYLAAAIQRGDEGDPAKTVENALKNAVANLTVFAPSNLAFQQLLTGQITQALIPIITQQLILGGATPEDAAAQAPALALAQATALASTPGVFTNPALASVLTPTTVKGMVVYHILGNRAFTVNLPTTATAVPTLLNGAIPAHPGVSLQATFGMSGVTAATVKGAANPTASNIALNPALGNGSSDQHYINGALHKIDQVLRPQ